MFYPYDNVYGKHCRLVKTVSHEHRWSLQDLQAIESLEKLCFSRISEGMVEGFLA